MPPKVVPGTIFLEIGGTLIFDDSIMFFHGFLGSGGAPERPKIRKIRKKVKPRTKDSQKATRSEKKLTVTCQQGARRAEKNAKERPKAGPGGPCDFTAG